MLLHKAAPVLGPLAALFGTIRAGSMFVRNSCSFSIWCASAINVPGLIGVNHDSRKVSPGGVYTATFGLTNNDTGAVVKCSSGANPEVNPYELEAAIDPTGVMFYDLSAEAGTSFQDHKRTAYVHGTACPEIAVTAGTQDNSWPLQKSCRTEADIWMCLCAA